jgi:hypothetical protein
MRLFKPTQFPRYSDSQPSEQGGGRIIGEHRLICQGRGSFAEVDCPYFRLSTRGVGRDTDGHEPTTADARSALLFRQMMCFRHAKCTTYENILTTPTQRVVAIAASTAFPPSFKTSTPIFEQRTCSLATAPCLASIR